MKSVALAWLCLAFTISGCTILTASTAYAQSEKRMVYTVVEQEPEFPGGKAALSRFLASTIKVPVSLGRKNNDTGPVSARFIIDELGYVHDVRVTMKPSTKKMRRNMETFVANIIEAVEKMPRWEPGEVEGKRVAVFYTLPIEINVQ